MNVCAVDGVPGENPLRRGRTELRASWLPTTLGSYYRAATLRGLRFRRAASRESRVCEDGALFAVGQRRTEAGVRVCYGGYGGSALQKMISSKVSCSTFCKTSGMKVMCPSGIFGGGTVR